MSAPARPAASESQRKQLADRDQVASLGAATAGADQSNEPAAAAASVATPMEDTTAAAAPATAAAASAASARAPALASSSISPTDIARILSVVPPPAVYSPPAGAWPIPSIDAVASHARLDALIPPSKEILNKFQRPEGRSTQAFSKDEKKDAEWHANHWLLLAAGGAIISLQLKRSEQKSAVESTHIVVNDHVRMVETLVTACRAKVDFRDEQGFSAVHWLIFDGLERAVGRAECDVDAASELRVKVDGLTRFLLEPRLRALLCASEEEGYSTWRELEEDEEPRESSKGSLLDLKDNNGNTPLHWCVHHRRVDLVGMLLLHGANAQIKNRNGQTPFDMVDWDVKAADHGEAQRAEPMDLDVPQQEAGDAAPAASASSASVKSTVHPLITRLDSSIYTQSNRRTERRWGLTEGLHIEQCSYVGESDPAAITRLLFSRLCYDATERGDNGDAAEVRRLVGLWKAAEASGARMFPLVFRWDAAWRSPLQTAAVYEDSSTAILRILLELPISFHVQPAKAQHSALHLAAEAGSLEAVGMLLDAGMDVNFRDVATNVSALSHISDTTPVEPAGDWTKIPRDELRAFSERITKAGKHLIDRGADPRSTDGRGNDCLQLAIYNALPDHLAFVQMLIDRIRQLQEDWLRTHVNTFGNAVMHVALYQTFDADVHASQLSMLLQAGVPVDQPANLIQLAPLDVWAGWESARADACAKRMDTTVEAVKARIKPTRKRVQARVIVPDVLQGNEKLKIPVMSEFDPPSSLVPDDFVYTWEQRAAAGSMGEAFVESQKLNARKGDLGEAGRRLNAVVTTRDQGAPGLLHLKYFSVRDTEYKGLGLFAKETIRYTSNGSEKGIQAFGELISRHEATRREVAYMREGAVGFTGQCVIDPISNTPLFIDQWAQGSLFRFINHSCNPNFAVWQMVDGQHAVAYPIRDIKADEEITIDYALQSTRTPRGTMICHCGEKTCRKKLI